MSRRLAIAFFFMGALFYAPHGYAANNQFIPVLIHKIQNNTASHCTLGTHSINAYNGQTLAEPLKIPFVSVLTYLKAYASQKVYTPQEALTIKTKAGRYRLWASESGVMYARDPKEQTVSLDAWKVKKLLSNTKQEHPGKKRYLATLVFSIMKNKLKVSLESAHS